MSSEPQYFTELNNPSLPEFKVELTAVTTNLVPSNVWITGAPLLWSQGINGLGVKVGVIDTGIDASHPDLASKVLFRRDYVKDGLPQTAYNSHATHVAGTIAANGRIMGIAPACSLIDYRVLDVNGSGSYASITQAINDCVTDKVNIINLSLGGPYDYLPLKTAIKNAVAAGILVVAASGNSGPNTISFPAYYNEVVSVGAVEFDINTGNITLPTTPWFSSSNNQVDCASDGYRVLSTVPNNRYAVFTGTSMSSPAVSGVAALLSHKARIRTGTKPTEPALFSYLKTTTIDILNNGVDIISGAGFLTFFPELPKLDAARKWMIPSINTGAPGHPGSAAASGAAASSVVSGLSDVRQMDVVSEPANENGEKK